MPTITVTTANICGTPLRPKVMVRRRMRRALAIPGVTFGQEVAKQTHWATNDYSTMWHRQAARVGKTTFGGGHEVPISIPNGWTVDGSACPLVHKGLLGVSPNRYLDTVKTEVDGFKVAFVNGHPPSKPREGVDHAQWRIDHWDLYFVRLVAEVAALHAEGYTVVFGGDMNKPDVPGVHPLQQTLISSGLDHLWIVPAAGVTVSAVTRAKIRRTVLMDHPILSATFTLAATR